MPPTEASISERAGGLVESHKGYDPRIVFFYFLIAAMLLTLVGGLAYQQLFKTGIYNEAGRIQSQRRVLVPGPRGNIYDREGRILVGNKAVYSVVLHIDELRSEFSTEWRRIRKNYTAFDKKDVPTPTELLLIARVSVAQSYLDKVTKLLGRDPDAEDAKINARKFDAHFRSSATLLPYKLMDGLSPADCAKLIESLPVNSPLQVYAASSRDYPYGSAAAHTLGAVKVDEEADTEDFPGHDLKTFKVKGEIGRDGLEKQFDSLLQGTPGGAIFRVDPHGYRNKSAIEERTPIQGKHLMTSLDIDLQQIAEESIGDQRGAAVAIDVATGEVLVLASKPDYDLREFSPRATQAVVNRMNEVGAWYHNAISAGWPPGSTFKIVTSVAAMRRAGIRPDEAIVDCQRYLKIGNAVKGCYNGREQHGHIHLSEAIAKSCDIYYYKAGEIITAKVLAEEAKRFHLHERTGIELPSEAKQMLIPDPEWRRRVKDEGWYPGDTANMAIGQGDVTVSPLGMACFVASFARGETTTVPTLLHDANRPRQRTEPIGLTAAQYKAIVDGMEGCTTYGSAKLLSTVPLYKIPGVRIAGKTGTAQKRVTKDGKTGFINYAWFICFAPVENPQIAMAVVIEGDTVGDEFLGGSNSAPVAAQVMKKYFEKKAQRGTQLTPVSRQ